MLRNIDTGFRKTIYKSRICCPLISQLLALSLQSISLICFKKKVQYCMTLIFSKIGNIFQFQATLAMQRYTDAGSIYEINATIFNNL